MLKRSAMTRTPTELEQQRNRKRKYRDRASERRSRHSEYDFINPPTSSTTAAAATTTERDNPQPTTPTPEEPPLAVDDRARKMMRSMGWQEGKGLGRRENGITRPLEPQGNVDRAGLGSITTTSTPLNTSTSTGNPSRGAVWHWANTRLRTYMQQDQDSESL